MDLPGLSCHYDCASSARSVRYAAGARGHRHGFRSVTRWRSGELFELGVRDRHLLTEANLFVACKLCHFAFDLHVGVLDPVRMTKAMCGRLRARYRRLEGRFRPLLVKRARFLALVLTELHRDAVEGSR